MLAGSVEGKIFFCRLLHILESLIYVAVARSAGGGVGG